MNDGLMTANEHNRKLNGILQEERDRVKDRADCMFPGCERTSRAGDRYCDTCSGEMKSPDEEEQETMGENDELI